MIDNKALLKILHDSVHCTSRIKTQARLIEQQRFNRLNLEQRLIIIKKEVDKINKLFDLIYQLNNDKAES